MYLRNSNLTKRLRAAGSRIVATPEQAEQLDGVSTLLSVSDSEQSTLHESDVDESEEDEVDEVDEDMESLMTAMEETSDEEDPQSAAHLKKLGRLQQVSMELRGKFVDLTDILPPLPQKGNFKVEDIKASPYFFS